jgi:hypothetical protein
MKTSFALILAIAPLLVGLSGCGSSPATEPQATNFDGTQFLLGEEPEGAVGVIAARESALDGAPLVLVGRIGGAANPWIEGRAAFTLLDASMTVVADGTESAAGQICTDDCCASERLACTTLVKVVDANGEVVPVDARKLLKLKESDMVVVQGTVKKDKTGNFTMLANRLYVRN